MENLKELQVAALLHDFGKFVRKYNGGRGKHAVLSGEFLKDNEQLCVGYDADTIISLVAAHHSDTAESYNNTVGVTIEPGKTVSAKTADSVYSLAEKADKELLRLLVLADSLSASSDRRSETSGGTAGHFEYAPLRSPIAQVFGKTLAVKSGYNYRVYEYNGTDDSKATVTSQLNDSNFDTNVIESYNKIKDGLSALTDTESLLVLLQKCWSTVNANTWKPAGSGCCNTTTSLFDHSKTTSAIAGCLLINKRNNVKVNEEAPNIDVWHMTCVGNNISLGNTIKIGLHNIGLTSACIIGNTGNEIYFMYPSSERENMVNNVKELNIEMHKRYGETLNFEIAENWQFKHCNESLSERFSNKFVGVLDVIGKVSVEDNKKETYNNIEKTIGGYVLNHYDYVINQIVENNDSISKLATTLRLFEMFSKETKLYLEDHGCRLIESSFNKCIYTVDKDDMHKIEAGIDSLYKKYVLDCTGLTFSNVTTDRYYDGVNLIKSELEAFSKRRKIEDNESYMKIRDKLFKLGALDYYKRMLTSASKVGKNTLFKVLKLYDDIIQYEEDHNAEHLVSLSKLQYLIANEGDEASKAFEKNCLQAVYDAEQDRIKPVATIYYEAILEESRRKR